LLYRILSEHPELPLFVFGMSMGGLIATRSAERTSDGIRGIVLLAPSFAVAEHLPPFVRGLLNMLRKIAPGFKLQPVAPSALARNPAVGEAYRKDPLTYHGGVTLVSATEIVDAGDAAIADAAGHVAPTLLLQGDADKLAFPIGATRFVQAAANNRDLTHIVVPGGYPELFNEPGGASLATTAADWMLARV
jgi:acylglycerol lipase